MPARSNLLTKLSSGVRSCFRSLGLGAYQHPSQKPQRHLNLGKDSTVNYPQWEGLHRLEQKPFRRVMVSQGRCGTHWLKFMIHAVLAEEPDDRVVRDHDTLKAALDKEAKTKLLFDHFLFDEHASILDPAVYPDLRMILLHRHPLDQFISSMWYQTKVTHAWELPNPQVNPNQNARGMLLGKYDEVLGIDYAKTFIETHRNSVLDWLESGRCISVKFEDLIERTEEELIRCFNHLEMRFDEKDVSQIVEDHRYEKLTAGRKKGDIKEDHHYRRGEPGEWRSVFTVGDLPILRKKYGDIFARQGYAI